MTIKEKNVRSKSRSNNFSKDDYKSFIFSPKTNKIDSSIFNKYLFKADNSPRESKYQEEIKRETRLNAHKREEDKKAFHYTLSKSFLKFSSIVVKSIIILYLIGLAINVFLKTSFDLSKIEVIVYTIITTGLGILIDRTLFNKYDE